MIQHGKERVAAHTAPHVQQAIEQRIERSVCYYAEHPGRIEHRLRELDEEWDVERVLETNASALSLFGLAMGVLGRRRWLILPIAVQGFFLQHALQGWCPPIPLLRRLGVRTREEIDRERYALKALRGDFRDADVDGGGGRDAPGIARRAFTATD
jgi:hypothetical protein